MQQKIVSYLDPSSTFYDCITLNTLSPLHPLPSLSDGVQKYKMNVDDSGTQETAYLLMNSWYARSTLKESIQSNLKHSRYIPHTGTAHLIPDSVLTDCREIYERSKFMNFLEKSKFDEIYDYFNFLKKEYVEEAIVHIAKEMTWKCMIRFWGLYSPAIHDIRFRNRSLLYLACSVKSEKAVSVLKENFYNFKNDSGYEIFDELGNRKARISSFFKVCCVGADSLVTTLQNYGYSIKSDFGKKEFDNLGRVTKRISSLFMAARSNFPDVIQALSDNDYPIGTGAGLLIYDELGTVVLRESCLFVAVVKGADLSVEALARNGYNVSDDFGKQGYGIDVSALYVAAELNLSSIINILSDNGVTVCNDRVSRVVSDDREHCNIMSCLYIAVEKESIDAVKLFLVQMTPETIDAGKVVEGKFGVVSRESSFHKCVQMKSMEMVQLFIDAGYPVSKDNGFEQRHFYGIWTRKNLLDDVDSTSSLYALLVDQGCRHSISFKVKRFFS
ncbi:hypothetical protein HOG98_07555 [bacterium]|nr:hypothetical protein [bacterium]